MRRSESARRSFGARCKNLLARTLRVDHDNFEQLFEICAEELHQRLTQFRSGSARSRLKGGNIVLANAQVVRELALRQPFLLAHRTKPGRPNLYVHFGIITRHRIFVKTEIIP